MACHSPTFHYIGAIMYMICFINNQVTASSSLVFMPAYQKQKLNLDMVKICECAVRTKYSICCVSLDCGKMLTLRVCASTKISLVTANSSEKKTHRLVK